MDNFQDVCEAFVVHLHLRLTQTPCAEPVYTLWETARDVRKEEQKDSRSFCESVLHNYLIM